MKTTVRRLPALPIALAATLLTAFLVMLSPLSASAHDSILGSSPEADSTVDTLPAELTLTFSAQPIDGEGATEIVVTDPTGASVTDGVPTIEGAIVTQPLAAEAPAGEYRVIWKIVSSDGHPTSGEFVFTVANSSEAAPTAEPSVAPTTAAPTPEQTAAPSPTATPEPADDADSSGSAWIWVLSIIGILIVAAVVVWLVVRGRRGGAATDSGDHSER